MGDLEINLDPPPPPGGDPIDFATDQPGAAELIVAGY
jgi:hypothetical protein